MSKRFDISAPRKKKDGGTYWVKVGTAWQNDRGGIQLVFDALPIPDSEGRVVASLFEPRERDGGQQQQQQRPQSNGGSSYGADLDDDVPF